jgi:HAD superfamily hydrolase (TIGR01490 family)
MQLALFDLDHTLLPIDSDVEWARFLVKLGIVDGPAHSLRNEYFAQQYGAGTLNIAQFLEFQLAPLARYPIAQLDAWHQRFMSEVIEPAIKPAARQLVAQHLAQGDLCALVTATNEFVTAPIAAAFGLPHLLATSIERIGDRYTGRPAGMPCFREGKITKTQAWLGEQGLSIADFERSWFYSDSANDLPLMACVSDPVATNPDPRLEQHARQQDWRVLQLFQ